MFGFVGHCEWLTPCTWEVGGGLVTVCGRVCIVLGDICTCVYLSE
jgi:hypothetical protein